LSISWQQIKTGDAYCLCLGNVPFVRSTMISPWKGIPIIFSLLL
jgi:hypothetical protein